jgi:hypothetical protein
MLCYVIVPCRHPSRRALDNVSGPIPCQRDLRAANPKLLSRPPPSLTLWYPYNPLILITLTKPHDRIPCTIDLSRFSAKAASLHSHLRLVIRDQAPTQRPTNAGDVKKGDRSYCAYAYVPVEGI